MKRFVSLLLVAAALLLASPAFAGPYLNSVAMLIRESMQSGDWVRVNLGDRELARLAHHMAEARFNIAGKMVVPKEVDKAHPHFLLVLSNVERAMDAAARGDTNQFVRSMDAARAESRTLRAVLDSLKFKLPTLRESPQSP
jgi:hypothetical protein